MNYAIKILIVLVSLSFSISYICAETCEPTASEIGEANKSIDSATIFPCDGILKDSQTTNGFPSIAKYKQMVYLNYLAMTSMRRKSLFIAKQMTCLFGKEITEKQIIEAIDDINNQLCSDASLSQESPTRRFILKYDPTLVGGFAWDPNPPYNGTVNPDGKSFYESLGIPSKFANDSIDNMTSIQKINFVDGLVHENTHALVTYLARKYNLSTEPKNNTCAVTKMRTIIQGYCDPRLGKTNIHRMEEYQLRITSSGYGEPTSGKYRNETIARHVSFVIAGLGCEETYTFLFDSSGKFRKP